MCFKLEVTRVLNPKLLGVAITIIRVNPLVGNGGDN